MRLVKQHAYTTPGGAALLVTPDECARLFKLPCWAFRLFAALIHCADFKTGRGVSGYPELTALMTPDQPERGKRHDVPTRDEIKHMLRRFVDAGLLARDKAMSEARGNIIFQLMPRTWDTVSGEIAARKLARGASAQNPDGNGVKRRSGRETRPETRPHLQEVLHISPTPENAKLSTGTDEHLNDDRAAPGEKIGPPRGADMGPDGPTPPQEALTEAGAGAGQGKEQGPPGGRKRALAGHAPEAVQLTDPSTWERDEKGRLIAPAEHGHHSRPRTKREPRNRAGPLVEMLS